MTGNLALDPTDPVFLLDESLVPAVARALQCDPSEYDAEQTSHNDLLL